MKKGLYILAALTALVACSKEFDNQNQVKPEDSAKNESNVHELFATLPELVDAETKAVINDENGNFAWEANDAIAVVTDEGNVYKYETTGSGSAARFTYTGDIIGTPTTIYFPWVEGYTATQYANMGVPTSISGLEGALSGDAIRLTGPITQSEGKYVSTLSYRNAFLRVTVKDVPAFATSIGFDEKGESAYDYSDDVTVNFTLTEKQDIVAYLPVVAGSKNFSVYVKDANGNHIIRKETSSAKSFTDGSLLTMKPLSVGHVLTFDNKAGWTGAEAYVWSASGDTYFNTGWNYPYKLCAYPDVANKYYVVLNTSDFSSWISEGTSIGVAFVVRDGEAWTGDQTQTNCVYLYRDLDFEIPEGGGMRTAYRVYFDNSSKSFASVNASVWSDTGIYVYCTDATPNVNYWISGEGSGWGEMNSERYNAEGKKYYYYDLASKWQTTLLGLQIGFSNNWWYHEYNNVDCNGKNNFYWYYNGDKSSALESTETTTNEFLSSDTWPGDAITLDSNLGYFEVPSTKYGRAFNFIFSNGGTSAADKSKEWHLTINRDYRVSE